MAARPWLRAPRPLVILAIGWAILVLYAFPGVMTMDSFDQLREGRAWFFTDAHPPVMAALWGIVDRIVAGPFGMLLLQSTSFLAGLYVILRRAMEPRRAAFWACALLLFPPIITPLAVIWKDSLMAGVLVLGIGAVLSERRWKKLLGLALFALATALRYNALAATLPLVVLLFEWTPGRRWFIRYAIGLGAWLLVVAVAMGGNAALTDKQTHYWYSSSALADITGVLAHMDHDLPDSELRPLLAPTGILVDTNIHAALRAEFAPYDFEQLIVGQGHPWTVSLTDPLPPERRAAIQHAWYELVTNHLGAYLRYRLDVFSETIGLREKFQGGTVMRHKSQYGALLDQFQISRGSSRFQQHAEYRIAWLTKHTRLFRPHVYLLLSLGLLLLTRRQRDVFALLLSGLFMELTLVPLGWTPDYRFSHWLVTCTCVSLVMLIVRRAQQPSDGRAGVLARLFCRRRPEAIDLGAQDR